MWANPTWQRAWLALLLSSCAGCYRASFQAAPQSIPGRVHETWTDFFLFGLIGSERFDVRDICGHDGVAEIRTGGNLGTGLVSSLTIGIYTPRKVYVTCSGHSHARPLSVRETRPSRTQP